MHEENSGLAALVERLKSTHEPVADNVGENFNPAAPAHLCLPEGMTFHDLTEKQLEALPAPSRAAGLLVLDDMESFKVVVKRFGSTDAMLYAHEATRGFTCVFDHHTPAGAQWGRFRANYRMPLSPEWLAWAEADGKSMEQPSFAEFLEDRIFDVVPVESTKLPQKVQDAIVEMNARVAGPSEIIGLSRGLSLTSTAKAVSKFDPSSGETSIAYEDEHQDAKGKPIKVPNLFVISIPIVQNGPSYLVPVRLRYRLNNGVIRWSVSRWRPDAFLKDAFDDGVKELADTKAIVVRGTPPERFPAR